MAKKAKKKTRTVPVDRSFDAVETFGDIVYGGVSRGQLQLLTLKELSEVEAAGNVMLTDVKDAQAEVMKVIRMVLKASKKRRK